ncbi:MAG: GNAT family N-acetyltransferase [Candidatus Acidiferrales bacterium]
MGMHPLDNPIWSALTTSQAHLGEISGLARKFQAEISPFAGFAEPTREAYAGLARLVHAGSGAAIFSEAAADRGDIEWTEFKILEQAPLLQMIYEDCELPSRELDFVDLTAADAPEMLALATMTKPGPFASRTHELGKFLGVRREGQLAATAGESMRMPGFTEISAVCTHPNHLGHGYATALMVDLIGRIRSRNETPFLRVRPHNTRAIELYRRLGFVDSRNFHYVVMGKSAA